MTKIGTTLSEVGKKALLCGSGELGKEVAIELQRYGVEVVALDKYPNAPAMQVAHRSYVLSMLDGVRLREIIEVEKPDYIIPEVEAIATSTLVELEKEGFHVTPTANAAYLTMNREGIRRLAAETLGIKTSTYKFASTREEFNEAVKTIGVPCVVKPIMSSSGHGQSLVRSMADMDKAWQYAQEGGRAGAGRVIVEGFVDFDYEITLLTVRHIGGTTFLKPIGHHQVDGDYRESWQPQAMSAEALKRAEEIAGKITNALGGWGIFGVELFVKGDDVIFSEVSPRPHDTGMVTMISQDLSEFALHARAVLGLPVPGVRFYRPSASKAIVVEGDTDKVEFDNLEEVLITSDVGVETTLNIIKRIEKRAAADKYVNTQELNHILRDEIAALLTENNSDDVADFDVPIERKPYVIMVVGVNGVGKTTTIGKLAYQFKKAGKSVYLGAADTFRAAAVEQLMIWGERVGVPVVKQKMGADPASVAYDTLSSAVANNADIVIIDTAGRLHNKVGLMNELTKIKNVMKKVVPDAPDEVLLVLDGSTGQNAFEQAKQFTLATEVTAMAITKLDGTAKGGVVIGISDQFKIPVKYIGLGEGMEDLQVFRKNEFVDSLFGENA